MPDVFVCIDSKPSLTHYRHRTDIKGVMMKTRRQSFRTTSLQRTSLEKIRVSLAEMGFHIFPVSVLYRRHVRDFVAIPQGTSHLLIVGPTAEGVLELRPYAHPKLYTDVVAMIRRYQGELTPVCWGEQLPGTDTTKDWKGYVPKKCELELQLFVG